MMPESLHRFGDEVWMRCPYAEPLCGQEAVFVAESIDDQQVAGSLVCVAGHRWRLERIGDTNGD